MAGVEETLVLTDASVEDRVRAAMESLGVEFPRFWEVEAATDWPGQELALDLEGRDRTDLAELVQEARAVLKRDAGIVNVLTSAEYAQLIDGLPNVTLVLTTADLVPAVRAALKPLAVEPFEVSVDVYYFLPGQEAQIQIYGRDGDRIDELIAGVREILAREFGITDVPTEADYAVRHREFQP